MWRASRSSANSPLSSQAWLSGALGVEALGRRHGLFAQRYNGSAAALNGRGPPPQRLPLTLSERHGGERQHSEASTDRFGHRSACLASQPHTSSHLTRLLSAAHTRHSLTAFFCPGLPCCCRPTPAHKRTAATRLLCSCGASPPHRSAATALRALPVMRSDIKAGCGLLLAACVTVALCCAALAAGQSASPSLDIHIPGGVEGVVVSPDGSLAFAVTYNALYVIPLPAPPGYVPTPYFNLDFVNSSADIDSVQVDSNALAYLLDNGNNLVSAGAHRPQRRQPACGQQRQPALQRLLLVRLHGTGAAARHAVHRRCQPGQSPAPQRHGVRRQPHRPLPAHRLHRSDVRLPGVSGAPSPRRVSSRRSRCTWATAEA